MKARHFYLLVALLLSVVQGARGEITGSGTAEDPYLISSVQDWNTLAEVTQLNTQRFVYFRQTADISGVTTMLGTESNPFAGTYDGDGHTLNVSLDSDGAFTAPFRYVGGVTIRHLHVTGTITGKLHTSGLIGACVATPYDLPVGQDVATNIIEDCHVSATIKEKRNDLLRAGGFIGHGGQARNQLSDCLFDGMFKVEYHVSNSYAGAFIGWSSFTTKDRQSLTNCLEKGNDEGYSNVTLYYAYSESDGSTDHEITLDRCYWTGALTKVQGTFVFDRVILPAGCTYKFVSDPTVQFGGKDYWTSGATIDITVPEGTPFNHWDATIYPTLFISDCFKASGRHTLEDVTFTPELRITTTPIPEAETERTLWGVTYRYLSRQDYHYYFSNETVKAKGWHFENGDVKTDDNNWDDNLLLYNANGDASELTVVTGYNESDYNDDGVQIHNDLVGDWRNHTHLAMIAPRAFNNSSALRTLYFKDTDANNYNTLTPFDFEIGNEAFANCPNLTEVKMMQYTTEGDNRWVGLNPDQIMKIGYDVFLGSPNAKVSTHRNVYQNYLSSATWKDYRSRVIIYDATVTDFTVEGVKYHKFRNHDETVALTNNEKDQMMDNHVRIWNANYQQFSASTLLDTKDGATVYYTYVVGVDDSDIDSRNGVMRIYNDPGSYYNYKTLALGRTAIAGNEHVKAIEFYQTNGNSDNSYSDLKFVIQNGALAGCTNLKELRMFYYVEEGTDHWESLGPKDVIPGNNIFGLTLDIDTLDMTDENVKATNDALKAEYKNNIPEGFKILVSPSRFNDFLKDPNWAPYATYIEPVDFDPTNSKKDFTEGGLTYSYATSPGGIMQTSQVVSQDVSWWTAPRIAAEVAIMLATLGTSGSATSAASSSVPTAATEVQAATALNQTMVGLQAGIAGEIAAQEITSAPIEAIGQILQSSIGPSVYQKLTANTRFFLESCLGVVRDPVTHLATLTGIIDKSGRWVVKAGTEDILLNTLAERGNIFLLATAAKEVAEHAVSMTSASLVTKQAALQAAQTALKKTITKAAIANALVIAGSASNSAMYASRCWDSYNGDALQKGMRANILSNIHQVGLVGGGYVITTPSKNLLYHNYIKSVDDNLENAVIYAGFDDDNNSTTSNITMTFARKAFQNKTNLKTISFHANEGQTSNASMAMLLTIPDSAFVGCTGLTELNLLLQTDGDGTRALGPENFILAGDSIFAGLDSLKFHILIDESRKQDFLDNESWAPLKRFFIYGNAVPATPLREYGAAYAYAYETNSIKKEHKVTGHLIEHTFVAGMDDVDYYGFAQRHQGAVKLCNDIGSYNNYQLDYVARKAFYGNTMLRTVSFTDLYGAGAFGDSYTGLDVTLQDSCFANCPNLANLDLVYMKTDGTNELQALTPQQVKVGKGILDGTTAKIKMMPQQVGWFEADSTWAVYKDRFMPCIIRKTDEAVYEALKDMRYYDPAATGNDDDYWDDYIDLARIAGIGFSWLDNRFKNNGDIRSFADFKQFESVGLDYVGDQWFYGCTNLSNIVLPSTIKRIGDNAFSHCTSLTEIEIPASVTAIRQGAFAGSTALNTIIVRGETPATLVGLDQFDRHDGLKIYVPADKVQAYKTAWSDYAQYIVSDGDYQKLTHITTTAVGQVAEKLGLTPVKENSKIRYLQGNYAKYDSLTVSGPLNGDDIAVLRHLMGANAWESEFTDGQLRYLNLWNADLKRDDDHSYNGYGVDEYLEKDNWVGEYMFHNCTALESVVLPASVTEIGENTFQDATALKRIAVGRSTTKYTRDLLQNLNGIEELVFLTDQFASSESSDPWEADIEVVYVSQSQLGDYMTDPALTRRTQNVTTIFEDEQVIFALADKEHYFPSEYLELESVNGIFAGNQDICTFDEFRYFQNVKSLEDGAFTGCTKLERIAIPDSVSYISSNVFRQCYQLSDIYFSTDSVPTIASDAFDFQVSWFKDDFRIYVPKELCKRYREAWPQYAQYINADNRRYSDDEIITVTVTQPNTLAQALGLTITSDECFDGHEYVNSVRGDYSKYTKLKVVGPISGQDLSILRYLAGFCPWTNTRNYAGHLEYLDLYDADLKASGWTVARDCYYSWIPKYNGYQNAYIHNDNEFPTYGLLQAYSLKTLILPKSCTKMDFHGLLECEGLEVLVIGDKMQDFNWNALDDDAMLTRLYILSEQKTEMSDWPWILRTFENNYSPTFDAFYVRPSLYEQYLRDENYTMNLQRTNLISKGEFDEDDSFCAFAAHGAATMDDLSNVTDVRGWFSGHGDIKDLTPLGYTIVDTLRAADMQALTKLERVTLPATLEIMEDGIFSNAQNLRYVDMLMCDSTMVVDDIRMRGLARLGIDSLQTLVYLPKEYGQPKGVNVVVANASSKLEAKTFRLSDGKDYCVPYAFETGRVENSRTLTASGANYTVCLPYSMPVPNGAKAYKLSGRDGNALVFTQEMDKMEALEPYLVVTNASGVSLTAERSQTIPASGQAFARQIDGIGYTMRGTLSPIDNATAAQIDAYILQASDNMWHPIKSGNDNAYIPAFRAYLLPSGGSVKAFETVLVDNDGTETSIEGIDNGEMANGKWQNGKCYDLSGRRLDSKPGRGIYINNGRKIIVK